MFILPPSIEIKSEEIWPSGHPTEHYADPFYQ